MKIQVPAANISFNASAKTVTFTSTVPATLDRILHVCNVTRGVIYFQPQAGAAFTGTYSSPTLTLAASTTGHANGDVLLVFIEDGTTTLPVSLASTPLPSGAATSALQTTGNTSLTSIDTKTPALVSGRVPVDGSQVTQPISSASLTSIDSKTPALVSGMSPVDVLLVPSEPRQLAAGATSTNQALTTTCRRISITARDANIRFSVGSTSQTASSTSHYIWQGERLEFAVPSSPNIAAIQAGTINGTLEITEFLPIS